MTALIPSIPFVPVENLLIRDSDRGYLPADVRPIIFPIEAGNFKMDIDYLSRSELRPLSRNYQNAFFFEYLVEAVDNRNVYFEPVDDLVALVSDLPSDVHRDRPEGIRRLNRVVGR